MNIRLVINARTSQHSFAKPSPIPYLLGIVTKTAVKYRYHLLPTVSYGGINK